MINTTFDNDIEYTIEINSSTDAYFHILLYKSKNLLNPMVISITGITDNLKKPIYSDGILKSNLSNSAIYNDNITIIMSLIMNFLSFCKISLPKIYYIVLK